MKELNVSIRPFDNFVPIDNQPYSLFFVSHNTTGLLPAGWFIQNPILLTKVARYKRTQSDFISYELILPKCW